jgi:hypothetical protein
MPRRAIGWSFVALLSAIACDGSDADEDSGLARDGGADPADADAAGEDSDGGEEPPPPRDPLPCFLDPGRPAEADELSVSITASRTTGVAPLSVFFDTVGTVSAATDLPFHELGFCWSFGDPESGYFSTNGLSRNQAKGPVASHVFERPGTYDVVVTARDAEGRTAAVGLEIVVLDPDDVFVGNDTICFANGDDFTGCPDGADHVTTSQLIDIESHVATGRRLLLRRGDTFDAGNVLINVAGPGIVGAFGDAEEDRPLIHATETTFTISGENPYFTDWRIMDLDIRGEGTDSSALSVQGKAVDLLLLRVSGRDLGNGVNASASVIYYWIENGHPEQDVADGLTLQDCELRGLAEGSKNGILLFASAHRMSLLGNVFRNSTNGQHIMRSSWTDRGVISNNDFGEAPTFRSIIKLHAPNFPSGPAAGRYTERVLISDNIIEGTGGHEWSVAIGPQNPTYDERVRDVIIERNLFLPGTAVLAIEMSGERHTVRNNIFHRGAQRNCMAVGRLGIEAPPRDIAVYHNTCFSEASARLIELGDSVSDTLVMNNLIAGDDSSSVSEGTGATFTNNLVTPTPGFVSATPTDGTDFALDASSAAVDTGDALPICFWDFAGRPRPIDGNGEGGAEPDSGALERAP